MQKIMQAFDTLAAVHEIEQEEAHSHYGRARRIGGQDLHAAEPGGIRILPVLLV
ncbi:MAG: hypothetical protein OHK005_20080 [Candidatus Methylacidiphilales bacterium]